MNREYIQQAIRNYIDNYGVFNETYKWSAVKQVQEHWNLDAPDLPEMIKTAFSKTVNLLNNATVSPSSGLALLAKEEPETIRRALSALVADYDTPDAEQDQLLSFVDEINGLLEKHFPGKWKYEHNIRNAITYRALIRPDQDYLYIFSKAKDFARAMEFPADIGSGKSFKLRDYYLMCDELAANVRESPELLETVKARDAIWPDKSRHLLATDLIFCFSSYSFMWKGIPEPQPYQRKTDSASREKIRDAKARALQQELEEIEEKIETLRDEVSALPPLLLVGRSVSTKAFGEGVIESQEGNYVCVNCQGKKIDFALPNCMLDGYVDPHDEEIVQRCCIIADFSKKLGALYSARNTKKIEISRLIK